MQAVILGVLLGVLVGLINFRLLLKTNEKVTDLTPNKAGVYVMLSYFIRIVLYAAAVIASVLIEGINALGTGAGILAVSVIYCLRYTVKPKE